jgi:DNA-binding MurR/RpiR family transcriptional regulator
MRSASKSQSKVTQSIDLLGSIQNLFGSFHQSELAIAKTVLNDPVAVSGMNITQLAEESDTSMASVVRFSRALGFGGYPEFRLALVGDLSRRSSLGIGAEILDGGITPEDSLENIVQKIAYADARAIEATADRLDLNVFGEVVAICDKARMIGIFGLVSSGFVAQDLQTKLNRLSKNAIAWTEYHSALTAISMLKEGDVLIAISHSGTTEETLGVIKAFKKKGVKVVLLTNALRGPSLTLADFVLHTAARETTFRSGATASRIAQLTVVDFLCVSLAQRNWSGTKAALDESRTAVANRSGKSRGLDLEPDRN